MATTVGVTTNSMLEKATLEAALANAASTQLPDEGNKNNMLHEENLSKQDDAALASSGDEQDAKEEKNSMLMSPNENKGMLMSPASGTTMMMKMSCSSPTFTESTTGVMHTNNVARADMNAEESSHASTTCTSTAHTSPNLPTEPETTMESMMEKSVEAIMEDNMQKLLMEENKKLLLNVDVAEKLEEKQTKTDGEKKVEKKAMVAKPPTQSDPSDEHVLRYQKYLDSSIRWKKVDEAWSWVDKMTSAEMPIEYQSVSALVKISLDSPDSLRQGKLRRAFSLLKRFLKRSKDAEEGLYNTCLDGFARLRDVQSMEQTLVDLRNHAYHARPGAVTYGTLIKAYGTLRDFNRVLLLWEEMRGTDIPPNAVTYGCMLDACVKCNHVEMAVTTFEDMKATNLHKNTVLYTTIIKGFAKIKDLSRAMKLYREMLAERVPCNVVTYNSLIDVAVRCNNMKVAAMVLQEMQSSGIMPDIITFSTLVKGFCNEGNLRKALLVANEARIRRLGVDEIMFNSLLDGCAKIGDFETGLLVFAEMQRCSIAPSCVTFSILVRLYSGVNRLYDAIDLVFRQMPYMWKVQPTRAVYSCLMKACAQQGDPMNVAYILGYTMKLPESQIKQLLRDAQAANPAAFETVEDRSLASSAAAAASYGFDCWGEKGAPFHEHKGGNYNSESKSGHFGKSWNSWNSERWNSEKGYGKGSHWQEGSYAGKGASQHKGASHKGSKGGHNYTEKGEGKHKKGSWGNGNHYNKGSNYNSSHNSGYNYSNYNNNQNNHGSSGKGSNSTNASSFAPSNQASSKHFNTTSLQQQSAAAAANAYSNGFFGSQQFAEAFNTTPYNPNAQILAGNMVAPGAQTNLIPGGPSNAVFAAGANTAVAANNMSATNMFNPLSAGGQAQLNGMAAGAQLNPQCLAGLNPFAVNPFSPSATGLNPFASGLNPFAAMPGMPYGAQPGMPEGAAYDFFGMGGDYLLPGAELEKTA